MHVLETVRGILRRSLKISNCTFQCDYYYYYYYSGEVTAALHRLLLLLLLRGSNCCFTQLHIASLKRKKKSIGIPSDVYELILLNLGMMLDITKLYAQV